MPRSDRRCSSCQSAAPGRHSYRLSFPVHVRWPPLRLSPPTSCRNSQSPHQKFSSPLRCKNITCLQRRDSTTVVHHPRKKLRLIRRKSGLAFPALRRTGPAHTRIGGRGWAAGTTGEARLWGGAHPKGRNKVEAPSGVARCRGGLRGERPGPCVSRRDDAQHRLGGAQRHRARPPSAGAIRSLSARCGLRIPVGTRGSVFDWRRG